MSGNHKSYQLNKVNVFPFKNRNDLINLGLKEKKILVAINAEKILNANDELIKVINDNIGYCDGVGAVWALKQKGVDANKIPGCELWLDIINARPNLKYHLIGSTETVIQDVVGKLTAEHPKLKITGYRNGFLDDEAKASLIQDVLEKEPEVVFVAQGTPRQEMLMSEMLSQHKALYVGLGGSFDVYVGNKKRAPLLFIKLKLEWLYRLLIEPTRIKRQLILFKFMLLLLFKRI